MSTAALVLAAGRGERLGAGVPKAFVELAGVPILVRALEAVAASPAVDRVVPVVAGSELRRIQGLGPALGRIQKVGPPVAGGAQRQDSVRAGLESLPPDVTLVAVHDAARALVRPEAVSRVVAAARRHGAALLAVAVRDTIKRVREGRVVATPPRAECWAAQTPQVFRAEILREALAKAAAEDFVGTDDAQLVERLGVLVRVVPGDPDNLKITAPEDLAVAELWLRQRNPCGGERGACGPADSRARSAAGAPSRPGATTQEMDRVATEEKGR